ncbi:hypothetical protein PoB_003751700 [Plakobranchus ocellatus]|uniref:Uncharacterized protein n=1 Tax=Plakobranchus ocellatus TaxID=259542 RepID=A0AAV4AVR8_9GAST|nr:hypothetical protein PoB_003751700 [Plakobranchus ocellatus]
MSKRCDCTRSRNGAHASVSQGGHIRRGGQIPESWLRSLVLSRGVGPAKIYAPLTVPLTSQAFVPSPGRLS